MPTDAERAALDGLFTAIERHEQTEKLHFTVREALRECRLARRAGASSTSPEAATPAPPTDAGVAALLARKLFEQTARADENLEASGRVTVRNAALTARVALLEGLLRESLPWLLAGECPMRLAYEVRGALTVPAALADKG